MDRIPASERTRERLKAICPFLSEHSYLDAERSLLAKCSTGFSSQVAGSSRGRGVEAPKHEPPILQSARRSGEASNAGVMGSFDYDSEFWLA
jgi:hypothetical protein